MSEDIQLTNHNNEKVVIVNNSRNKKKLLLILLILLVLIFFTSAFFVLSQKNQISLSRISPISKVTPTPTPGPFDDLTIPYLRSRQYYSELGKMEKYSETSSYTSYLTSYTSDGLRINGLLTQPKGEMPNGGWPAVIFIHGYIPPTQYRTTQNYASYTDYLSRNGLVVFKIDLRGHDQSEGEPGGAYYSSDYIIDALNAYSALQKSNFVNPKGIGFWGHSMAGNVVMRTLAAKPDIPAIVIWAGAVYTYTDFAEYGISDSSYQPPPGNAERVKRRNELRELYGEPTKDSAFWKQVAPTNFLGDIKGSIQIHHAVNDNVVDIRYSQNLSSLAESAGLDNEYYEYQDGGHNLTGASFNSAMQRTVEFFKEKLKES